MENRFDKVLNNVMRWQEDTFPKATAKSKLLHLREEIEELLMEISNPNYCKEDIEDELADCYLLLFGASHKLGFSLTREILDIIEHKFYKNLGRNWQEPDENNVYRHIK